MPETFTDEELQTAIDMAAHPEDLFDQKGRVWSRWQTFVPGHFRSCKKCGKKLQQGYILQPNLETTICSEHVKRPWI